MSTRKYMSTGAARKRQTSPIDPLHIRKHHKPSHRSAGHAGSSTEASPATTRPSPCLRSPLLTVLLALFVLICGRTAYAATSTEVESADYVIIGGGTAGCALARRLCENLNDASILLLERGLERSTEDEQQVRALRRTFDSWLNPNLAEVFLSTPNSGLGGRPEPIITGRTLGGTSAINAGQWTVPGLQEVESWGFEGLTKQTARVYFDTAAKTLRVAQPPRGLRQEVFDPWLAEAPHVGIEISTNPLDLVDVKTRDHAAVNALAAKANGQRLDSCTAYLPQGVLRGRCGRNLRLEQRAVVTQILIADGEAVGVRYRKYDAEGETYEERLVEAAREVISCAGPYGSPQLLQASGIGPADVLRAAGVPLILDLPVGSAVQGRPVGRIIDLYTTVPLAPENDPHLVFSKSAQQQFNAGKGGVLGITIGAFNGALIDEDGFVSGTSATPSDVIGQPLYLLTCLINPTSRGTLKLAPGAAERSPLLPPDVTLNLLGTPGEAETLQRCLERLGEVNDAVRATGALGLVNIEPGPAGINSTYLERTTTNSYHFVAGAKVGAVVDRRYRVHGIGGLRVVDASVIPRIPRYAGVMASVYALAEHASRLVISESGSYGDDSGDSSDSDSDSSGSDSSDESEGSEGSDDEGEAVILDFVEEEDPPTRGFAPGGGGQGGGGGGSDSDSDDEVGLLDYGAGLVVDPYNLDS